MRGGLAAFLVGISTVIVAYASMAQQPPVTPPPPATQVPATPAPATPPPAPLQVVPPATPVPMPAGRMFGSDAGMIFNPIKPDKTIEFEQVMVKLKDALMRSDDPVRQKQAAGWKVFKAVEPGPNANVLYIFVMDPAVKGADYTVSKILSEAYPTTEVQELYKLYIAAYAGGQSLVNLELIQHLGAPAMTPIIPR